MNRTPEEIIKSILANLTMAMNAARDSKAKNPHNMVLQIDAGSRERAFQEAITLIKTESGIP